MNRLVAIMLLIGLLAACGQRGPLYLPEKGKPKKIKSSTARKAAAVKPHGPAPEIPGDRQVDAPASKQGTEPRTEPDTEAEAENSSTEE